MLLLCGRHLGTATTRCNWGKAMSDVASSEETPRFRAYSCYFPFQQRRTQILHKLLCKRFPS